MKPIKAYLGALPAAAGWPDAPHVGRQTRLLGRMVRRTDGKGERLSTTHRQRPPHAQPNHAAVPALSHSSCWSAATPTNMTSTLRLTTVLA